MNPVQEKEDISVIKKVVQNDFSKVLVDADPSLNLETNGLIRSCFNLVFIPILNNLPSGFRHVIKKTNKAAAEVIDNATNHHALEVLYSRGNLFSTRNYAKRIFQYIWFNIENSKAVRNRLKFVIRELENHLRSIAKFDKEINIISIASGSSRALIETIEAGRYLDGTKLSITFLDRSEHAIAYSKKLSTKIQHLPVKMEWINDTAGSFLRNPPAKRFDVVEMVGLLDYFPDDRVIETFKAIHGILADGGIMITANVNHNREEKFVTKIIDWKMIYRTGEEMAVLAKKAGFEYNNMKVFYEPLRIHSIMVAKK